MPGRIAGRPNRGGLHHVKAGAHTIGYKTREHHETLCKARQRQKTEEFRGHFAARTDIEGTHEQAIRHAGCDGAVISGRPKRGSSMS